MLQTRAEGNQVSYLIINLGAIDGSKISDFDFQSLHPPDAALKGLHGVWIGIHVDEFPDQVRRFALKGGVLIVELGAQGM